MPEQSRPLWGIIFGVLIIAALGGLFFYGQKQRMAEEIQNKKIAAEEKKAKEVIVIGGILPTTSESEHSELATALQKVAGRVIQEINTAGGIKGRPVKMVWEDGNCDSADAAAAAQKLVTVKEAKYVIDGFKGCEEEFPSVLSVTEQSGTLLLSPLVSHANLGLTEPGLFLSLFDTADARVGEAVASYAITKLHAKRAAVIYNDAGTEGEDLRIAFKQSLLERGGELVIDRTLADMLPDNTITERAVKKALPKLIADIKQSGAEVIYLAEAENMSFYLADEFSKALPEIPIITTDVFDTSAHNVLALKLKPDMDTITPVYSDASSEKGTASILYLLKDALTATGNNPEKVRNFLLNIRDWHWPGGQGTLNFTKNGDRVADFGIWQSVNGKAKQTGSYSLPN